MANNKLIELIEKLKTDDKLSAEAEAEIGDNATEEQVDAAIQECIISHLKSSIGLADVNRHDESIEDFIKETSSAVKSFFDDEEWHYTENYYNPGLVIYELGFKSQKNCSLRMRVQIEAIPRVCRIDAILPITADDTYDYLLCKSIAKENYPRRFGALQYDERDGEVSYRYSYPIGHGLFKDDLMHIFLAVASSASDSYFEIKKHCIGKYKPKEMEEILKKVDTLVRDLSNEDE